MHKNHYSGGLTREQFLFYEIKIVAGLLGRGRSRDEIYREIQSENLFQFPTERMIKTITNTCFKRVLMTYFGVNYILGGMHSYANA